MKKRFLTNSSKRIILSTMMTSALMVGVPQAVFAEVEDVLEVMQASTVKGRVVDANGEPVIGASVSLKGTTTGVISGLNGDFSINNVGRNATLVISFVGYQTQEVSVNGRSVVNITLKEDTELLDEVVVVGYGTQKKATLSGAVASVGGEVLENRPVSNTAIGLQGQIPGLTITRTTARPGNEDMSIKLRGASSINTTDPLIIIDGVPAISNTEFSSLNPNDIENISVLKDASAAIYGSRAAGGVILVTTKKGKKGEKIKVTYNGMITANTPANMLPLADMKAWATAYVDASYQDCVISDGHGGELVTQRSINGQIWNDVLQPTNPNLPNVQFAGSFVDPGYLVLDKMALGEAFDHTKNGMLYNFASNNWIDLLYGTTYSTQHNASVQGSSERARWMASIGYADDNSIIIATKDGAKKYNARLNADFDITKWLVFNMNMSYSNRVVSGPRDGLDGSNSGFYDAPAGAAYTPNGDYYDFYVNERSPLAQMKEAGRKSQEFETFRYSNSLIAQITKDFRATGSMAFIKNNNIETETKTPFSVVSWDGSKTNNYNTGSSSYVQERIQRTFYENYQLQIDYSHTFAEVHNVAAMIGTNAERNTYKNVTAKRTNLLYNGLYDLSTASSEAANQSITGGSNQSGYISYFSRLNYNYAGKYMIELLGRRDGTSKFHPDYRWSNFGAGSIGYRISEEAFMKNIQWLNNLKLRASYGITGGAVTSLGNYDYLSNIKLSTYYFNGGLESTSYLASMTDYSRTWEKLHNFNIGIDFAFLNNRLTGSFDWYQKKNDGMLVALKYSDLLGATAPATNSAKLTVKGWEAQIGWNDKVGGVEYWVNASLADARSMVTDYAGTDTWTAGWVKVRKGYPLNSLFLYKTDGYFTSYEEIAEYYKQYANCTGSNALGKVPETNAKTHLRPGDRKKVLILDPENDTTGGKGNTGSGDVYYYGDSDPHFTFGVNAGAKWKNFDFSIFVQGVGKQYMIRGTTTTSNGGMNMCAFYRSYNNILTTHLDTWTWDNQDARYARLSLENNKNDWNCNNNDSEVQNAWYARLKNVTLGYTIPKGITQRWNIEKLRFFLSGDNATELTGVNDGYDPEKSGVSRTTLPFSRSWSLGVDLTF